LQNKDNVVYINFSSALTSPGSTCFIW
jgi:hypothetical protein